MTKQQARAIFKLSALPEWQLLIESQVERLNDLRRQLDTVNDLSNLKFIQGQIAEIKKFNEVRETATTFLDKQ
jgi:hypothetical protein